MVRITPIFKPLTPGRGDKNSPKHTINSIRVRGPSSKFEVADLLHVALRHVCSCILIQYRKINVHIN